MAILKLYWILDRCNIISITVWTEGCAEGVPSRTRVGKSAIFSIAGVIATVNWQKPTDNWWRPTDSGWVRTNIERHYSIPVRHHVNYIGFWNRRWRKWCWCAQYGRHEEACHRNEQPFCGNWCPSFPVSCPSLRRRWPVGAKIWSNK